MQTSSLRRRPPTRTTVISALPQGYKTFLGERGVRLSGRAATANLDRPGDAEEAAAARLLGKATSALDAEGERMVQAALESAMQHRTTIVIAHRLSTVQRADRIVVMEAGEIVETGTHAELVASGGLYARLAALQFDR